MNFGEFECRCGVVNYQDTDVGAFKRAEQTICSQCGSCARPANIYLNMRQARSINTGGKIDPDGISFFGLKDYERKHAYEFKQKEEARKAKKKEVAKTHPRLAAML